MTTKNTSTQDLIREAKESGHGESYHVLKETKHYRMGVGAVLEPSGQFTFYVEVLIGLCAPSTAVKLPDLEQKLQFAKELEARGYSLDCQDGCYITCDKTVHDDELAVEYEAINSLVVKTFNEWQVLDEVDNRLSKNCAD